MAHTSERSTPSQPQMRAAAIGKSDFYKVRESFQVLAESCTTVSKSNSIRWTSVKRSNRDDAIIKSKD